MRGSKFANISEHFQIYSTSNDSLISLFRADGLPKHHDMTDAVPLKLDTEFMSPGRVLKEINPPDPAAAATSPDGVNKQPLDFRFSVSQLPSWAQKRVSVNNYLFRKILNEPLHEKTNNLSFQHGPTQTSLYSHRSRLEA